MKWNCLNQSNVKLWIFVILYLGWKTYISAKNVLETQRIKNLFYKNFADVSIRSQSCLCLIYQEWNFPLNDEKFAPPIHCFTFVCNSHLQSPSNLVQSIMQFQPIFYKVCKPSAITTKQISQSLLLKPLRKYSFSD